MRSSSVNCNLIAAFVLAIWTASRCHGVKYIPKAPRQQIRPKSPSSSSASNNCGVPGTWSKDCGTKTVSNFTHPPLRARPHDRAGEQLIEDLLFTYNKNVRPTENASSATEVKFAASLIRIIDLNEKTQQLTTNLWLDLQWRDPKLKWDPAKYGNIFKLNIPADFIWKPDIVLYNNADGQPDITINVDTLVYFDGTVVWKPPAIYRSFCEINVKLFPYDIQDCKMKFGDWTYDGSYVDTFQNPLGYVKEMNEYGYPVSRLNEGMDLSYFQESAEWDLLELYNEKQYIIYGTCCGSYKYADVTFYFKLRRKALFFTVFLVIPCILIAALTTFVSLLPSCSMKKMTLAISILVSLMVFATALVDLVPPNSIVTPLIMQYLLFTMVLVTVSIGVNVMALNLHYRNNSTHVMPPWIQWFFLKKAPKLLCMKIPEWHQVDPRIVEIKKKIRNSVAYTDRLCGSFERRPSPFFAHAFRNKEKNGKLTQLAKKRGMHPVVVKQMIKNVNAIAELFSSMEDGDQIKEDWSYVGLVLDRMTLWIFTLANLIGTALVLREAMSSFYGEEPLGKVEPKQPLGGDTYLWTLLNMTNHTL